MAVIKFYSVKSRKSVEVDVSKVKKVMLKNGRPAAEAIDPETGVKMFKILSAADAALLQESNKNPSEVKLGGVFGKIRYFKEIEGLTQTKANAI